MAENEVTMADDGYDELEAIFSGKDIPIPGDEVTGEVTEDGNKGEADDATGDSHVSTDAGDDDLDTGDVGTSNTSGEGTEGADTSTSTGDDETGKEPVATTTEDKTKVDTEEENLTAAQQEARLRAQLREQARKTALMEAKLDTLARQRKADHDALEDNEELKDVELSPIEQHQAKLNEIAQTRGDVISDMLEMMLVNPKYQDVETVCTKANLDETIEMLAQSEVEKNGGNLVETMMGLEVDIWSQKNPYRYMYSLIKDIHPQFVKGETQTETKTGDKQDTGGGKKTGKAPAKAPLSAADLSRGGGGKNLGEWTADKIDNLSEMELNKVPADVYEKYLRGDLDK